MLLTSMEKSKRECEGPDVSELSNIIFYALFPNLGSFRFRKVLLISFIDLSCFNVLPRL